MVAYQNRGYEMSKFTEDFEMCFDHKKQKFTPKSIHTTEWIRSGKTFSIHNRVVSLLTENLENCHFFNITMPDGSNEWWWAYSYNLMFQAIDFDWDTDIWLCKVIGYIE